MLTKQFQLKELLSFLLVQKINLSCSRIRKLLVVHLPRLSLMYSLLMLSMISICPILKVGKYIMINQILRRNYLHYFFSFYVGKHHLQRLQELFALNDHYFQKYLQNFCKVSVLTCFPLYMHGICYSLTI